MVGFFKEKFIPALAPLFTIKYAKAGSELPSETTVSEELLAGAKEQWCESRQLSGPIHLAGECDERGMRPLLGIERKGLMPGFIDVAVA